MTIALTLLVTALQLKLALLGLPVEYKSTVDQMMPIVETAISTANAEIAKGNQATIPVTVVQTTQVLPQPSFGSTIVVMEDKSDLKINTPVFINKKDVENSIPFGVYTIKVEVLDTNGKNVKMSEVTMSAQDSLYSTETRQMDSVTELNGSDWHHVFTFTPTKTGEKVITFTGNGFTKNVTVDVK